MASKKRAADVPLDQLDEKNTMRNEEDDPRASEDDGRCQILHKRGTPWPCC
jgi:hypothetical protein